MLWYHPNRCVVSSPESRPPNRGIPRNFPHPWPHGLGCVSRGCENVRYIGEGGVQSGGALYII